MAREKANVCEPSYIKLLARGVLQERVRQAYERLRACDLCGHRCRVDRLEDHRGFCRTGYLPLVASYGPHFGEEAPLVGHGGSGTIFFSYCNLKCLYCQNYDISQIGHGQETTPEELASIMIALQEMGCHNINLVSPTHVVPQILASIALAAQSGLSLPIVYNTGGYDAPVSMRLLGGIVDVYMPDAKYADSGIARSLSGVRCYPAVNRAVLREAQRGIARRGLLVRHLVLPGNLAGSEQVLSFIAREVSIDTYINIMEQYRPCHRANEVPQLTRRITRQEHEAVLQTARELGLWRLDGYWRP